MSNHAMLDLETHDTEQSAIVLSIGICIFDPRGTTIGESVHLALDPDDQYRRGRTISPKNVRWWMQQSPEARSLFAPSAVSMPVVPALAQVSDLFRRHEIKDLWGNGADFDNVILGSLYATYGIVKPWSYSGNRCFRTMRESFPQAPQPMFVGTKHNALDDAVFQARRLQAIFRWLDQQSSGSTAEHDPVKTPQPTS